MPATAERLEGRDAIVSFPRPYPEPWGVLTVAHTVGGAEGAAAEGRVEDPSGRRFAFGAVWRSRGGSVVEGTGYRVEGDEPPAGRAAVSASRSARAARDAGRPSS